jgi:hypothetical protein
VHHFTLLQCAVSLKARKWHTSSKWIFFAQLEIIFGVMSHRTKSPYSCLACTHPDIKNADLLLRHEDFLLCGLTGSISNTGGFEIISRVESQNGYLVGKYI